MAKAADIQAKIQAGMPAAQVQVLDPMNDGQHLQAIVVSTDFAGKPMIARHRLVYAALGDAFRAELHALQLKTITPDEVKTQEIK